MSDLTIMDRQCSRVDTLMWKASKLLAKRKKVILDEFELTCSQFDILAAIVYTTQHNQEVIQIELAENANIDPMTTSTILRNLEKRGLISRERGLINTRTVEVEISESGLGLYNKASKKIETLQQCIYKSLDCSQLSSQLEVLTDKLNKL